MDEQDGKPIRIGLVGVGKIARDQHVPALRANSRFELAATASLAGSLEGIASYSAIETMIAGTQLDAVTLCTPPGARLDLAAAAFAAGLHVMLEKPTAATLGEVARMRALAAEYRRSLFASWHSREAAGVARAADFCRSRALRSVRIVWHENIRQWHPGQEWIMGPGGFGVFDPGINALSILTAILRGPVIARSAMLDYPANRAAPIAATAQLSSGGLPIELSFDFLQEGEQTWSIVIEAEDGTLHLDGGGAELQIDGAPVALDSDGEYDRLYANFAGLIANGQSDCDSEPLRLVADLLLTGDRRTVAAFEF